MCNAQETMGVGAIKGKGCCFGFALSFAKIDIEIDEGFQVIESDLPLTFKLTLLFCFVFILRALSCYVGEKNLKNKK